MCFHVLYEVLGHQDQSCLLDSQVNIQDTKKINKNPSFFFFLRSCVKVVEALIALISLGFLEFWGNNIVQS